MELLTLSSKPLWLGALIWQQVFHEPGLWWDTRPGINQIRRIDFSVVAVLEKHYNQFVLEYIPENLSKAAFFGRRNKYNSLTKRAPASGDALKWHLRMGHPGPRALENLVNCSTGARIKGLFTYE